MLQPVVRKITVSMHSLEFLERLLWFLHLEKIRAVEN